MEASAQQMPPLEIAAEILTDIEKLELLLGWDVQWLEAQTLAS